ncbi:MULTISPECIES: hypothetical protein, partial [unclassified Paenibacillus]|uniref:hypothetical protein n=1 Tax=unclassified Paenibacillus TaxID=185978 RepID=UPI001A9BE870
PLDKSVSTSIRTPSIPYRHAPCNFPNISKSTSHHIEMFLWGIIAYMKKGASKFSFIEKNIMF